MTWQVRRAEIADLPAIEELVASVGGDLEDLRAEQFVVAQDDEGNILGCGRLKPYPDLWELASIAVKKEWQAAGIGRAMVDRLLEQHRGPVYLVCEDDTVGFFRRFGFKLVPPSEAPSGLEPKRQRYAAEVGHLNVMRRG